MNKSLNDHAFNTFGGAIGGDRVEHRKTFRAHPAAPAQGQGNRHHSQGAVEGGQIEVDPRPAVGAGLDDSRNARERLLRRQFARKLRGRIAAGADRAARPLHSIDQQTVKVVDFRAQLALAEEIAARIGRLIMGEIEDAHIDSRDRHSCLLSRAKAFDFERDRQRTAWARLGRWSEFDIERMRLRIDGKPGKPDGPARHTIGRLIEWTIGEHHHISARAPIAFDHDRGGRVALNQIERRQSVQTLADNGDRRGGGKARGDAQPHLFARLIACLVETDFEKIRSFRAFLAGPAALEGKTRRQIGAVAACKVEPILVKSNDRGNLGWRCEANIDLSSGNALRGFHLLESPASVGAIPLLIVVYSIERPGDALARGAGAVRAYGNDNEVCRRALGQGREILLDADEAAIRQGKKKRWPALKKNCARQGRTIVFIDESGVSERPHRVRTWAPKGKTPVLQYNFTGNQLSAVAGVTFWNIYFKLVTGAVRAPKIFAFRKNLRRHLAGRKLLIIWDRLQAHHSRLVRD